jgi:hemoglobin/transferrin/lactoferrin receptor protein
LTYSPVQHWTFEGRISYQYGRSTESTGDERKYEPLRHAAPLFGQVGLTFEKRSWLSGLQLAFNGEITHENLAPSERAKPHLYALNNNGDPFSPGWHRLDWRLQKKWGALTTTIAVENISNQRYRTYSSGIVAAGLNFVFSAAYSF